MPIRRRSVMARRIVAQGICIDPRRGSGEKNDDAARSRAFGMRLQKRASPRRRAATADRDDRPRRGTARPERHRRRDDADGRGRRQPVGRGGGDGGGGAVLAYSPSQHGKHAVLACLAAWALRGEPYFDDVVTQCAIYAAESRQPWSEPPIMSPPAIDDDQRGDLDELLEAIAASDRLRGERWLARRLDDGDLARDYFAAAADD